MHASDRVLSVGMVGAGEIVSRIHFRCSAPAKASNRVHRGQEFWRRRSSVAASYKIGQFRSAYDNWTRFHKRMSYYSLCR